MKRRQLLVWREGIRDGLRCESGNPRAKRCRNTEVTSASHEKSPVMAPRLGHREFECKRHLSVTHEILHREPNGRLWIGTYAIGLLGYDPGRRGVRFDRDCIHGWFTCDLSLRYSCFMPAQRNHKQSTKDPQSW